MRAGGGNFGKLSDLAPPIDFAASFDSLDIMEWVMRHFYLRALIEERMGNRTDWKQVDGLMMQALTAAEKVARYRHAQLSAVKLAATSRPRSRPFRSTKDQGGTAQARTLDQPRGFGSRRGREPRRLNRGESNQRAQLAFRGLSPAGPRV